MFRMSFTPFRNYWSRSTVVANAAPAKLPVGATLLTRPFLAPMVRAALALGLCLASQGALAVERVYEILYEATIDPQHEVAEMRLVLNQPSDFLREVNFRIDPKRHRGFDGDGEIEEEGPYLRWVPPQTGGELRWRSGLTSRRKNHAYDGMITGQWAIFRGDDLVPPARTRSLKGARSQARLRFVLPDGWSSVTAYRKSDDDEYVIAHEDRSFDRPTGWMALGDVGVRWATIADTQIAVAGPVGHGFRRQDILAFMRWTFPAFKDIFPGVGHRLLIVGAGDPMWRGGLSGPDSLFIHADRPLISENGTSTLLHELGHVAMPLRAEPGADWIVEGLAEYYALEVLVRSGTTSPRRHRKSLEDVEEWGRLADDLFAETSSGEITARAVTVMRAVDEKIRTGSEGSRSLDDLVRILIAEGSVSYERFRKLAEELAGRPVKALSPSRLPGSPEK